MNPYILLAIVLAIVGSAVGGFFTGADYQKDQCELEKAEAAQKYQSEKDAAAVKVSESAAAAEATLSTLRGRNAQLEQEVIAYANDQTRVRRQCFDARGSLLWNRAAAAPAAVPGVDQGAVQPRAAGAAEGRGQ